jgi:hypothetical protein
MPIRFRCAYCNQLMGIATRKAGQVVKCPKCAGEIIVPVPDGMEPAAPEPAPPMAAFEDKAFEQLMNEPAVAPDVANATATVATPEPNPADFVPPPAPTPEPRKRLGIFLPLGMLFVSLIVIVLLMVLMFVLGLIIGRHSALNDVKAAAVPEPLPAIRGST